MTGDVIATGQSEEIGSTVFGDDVLSGKMIDGQLGPARFSSGY